MDAKNTKYRIRQCSKCPGDLEYFCVTCSSDLCLECKENHMMNLDKDMCNVIIYREKSNYLQKHEICIRHPNNIYTKYCELCRIPICTECTDRSLTENESKNTDWHQWSIYLLPKPKPRVFHLIYCSVALISIKPKV